MEQDVLISVIAAGVAIFGAVVSFGVAIWTSFRSGSQKRAEARMVWNEAHRKLSVELSTVLDRVKKNGVGLNGQDDAEAVALATEILLLINPDGKGRGAEAEKEMERDLLDRFHRLNLSLDMAYVRLHRAVLKAAWNDAKREF
jgi:hypothetical protein